MILVLGEVLFDLFPDAIKIGGAPFNFACHLKNLGYEVHLISRIGRDELGQRVLQRLEREGFDPSDMQVDDRKPTGRVEIQLDEAGVPTFDIKADMAYDHMEMTTRLEQLLELRPELIYFGTVAQRTEQGFRFVQSVLDLAPHSRLFYDVNLRPGCYRPEVVRASTTRCDYLKINEGEWQLLIDMFGCWDGTSLANKLLEEEGLAWICETRGSEGSRLMNGDGILEAPAPALADLVDTVGAGDAFGAVMAMGSLQDWAPQLRLQRAAQFAARICGIEGAVPDRPDIYRRFSDSLGGKTS